MPTNEMALAKAFREAGFPQDKAETVAETIFAAIRDNVATKSDLKLLELALRGDIQALAQATKSDIQALAQATKSDIQALEQATKSDLTQAIDRLEHRLTLWGLGALAAGLSALFAALHYWPPHMTP